MMKLKPRMAAAASFARPGKTFADIGTDHAYLPVFLCESGIAPSGIASDIHRGPLSRAEKNIGDAGLGERIRLCLADGLDGCGAFRPEDIYILGMGGELIASILERAPWVRDPAIRLILQPMTHPQDLRRWLLSSGFAVTGEVLVREEGRIYQLLCASYDGTVREWDDCSLAVGRLTQQNRDPLLPEYAKKLAEITARAALGVETSGKDASGLRSLEKSLLLLASGQE